MLGGVCARKMKILNKSSLEVMAMRDYGPFDNVHIQAVFFSQDGFPYLLSFYDILLTNLGQVLLFDTFRLNYSLYWI